jgi:hypothetical protein
MNAPALRGLAVLCLLCVLPKLGAMIVQTATFYGFDERSVGVHRWGTSWAPTPYANAAEPLSSALITATVSISLTGREYNPYDYALFAGTSTFATSTFSLNGSGSTFISERKDWVVQGATVSLDPKTWGPTIRHVYTFEHQFLITDPSTLSAFLSNKVSLSFSTEGFIPSSYGSSVLQSMISATVGYNVADDGPAALLFAPAAGILLWIRRRFAV